MLRRLAAVSILAVFGAIALLPRPLVRAQAAAAIDTASVGGAMRRRPIRPFRGGRTKAITGVRGNAHVFYMAPVNGGVWKTTDAGRTWTPTFDDQPTGSVGSIAVAPSDPDIICVGQRRGVCAARPLGRRRDLQVARQRHDVASADARAAGRRHRAGRRNRSPNSPGVSPGSIMAR
jgi:hypothetical protein